MSKYSAEDLATLKEFVELVVQLDNNTDKLADLDNDNAIFDNSEWDEVIDAYLVLQRHANTINGVIHRNETVRAYRVVAIGRPTLRANGFWQPGQIVPVGRVCKSEEEAETLRKERYQHTDLWFYDVDTVEVTADQISNDLKL